MSKGFTAPWKHPSCFPGATDMYLSVLFIDCTRGREMEILVAQKPFKDLIIDYAETLHVLL